VKAEIQERFADAEKYDAMMAQVFPGYEQWPLVILSWLRARLGPKALRGFPEPVQSGVRHKATVEDSLVSEERIRELLAQAGFVDVERIFQAMLLGGWIARKA